MKLSILFAIMSVLTGCSATGVVQQPNAPQTVPAARAMVVPPPGGPAILTVVEHQRGNGVDQSIALFTSSAVSGQNYFKIRFLGKTGMTPDAEGVRYTIFTDAALAREAQREVPGVKMARSTLFLQNSYGPFSYSWGRSSLGDTCIFAWQQIRASQQAQTQARNFGMIQIRLRLCDARADERQLLGVMYGFTLTAVINGEVWNPFGPPPSVNASLGQTGAPVFPDAGGYRPMPMPMGYDPAPARFPAPAGRASTIRRAAAANRASPAAAMPQPVGPRVPMPGSAGSAAEPAMGNAAGSAGTATPTGIAVPGPDCIGDGAKSARCQN